MDRFQAMLTLIAAVDGGSLTAASRSLGVPLPTVSRRISELEAHVGAQLLVRTSRKFASTEAGDAFIVVARKLLDELGAAERAAAGEYQVPRGALLVTAPILFGRMHVGPIVHAFLHETPDVTVRLVLSDSVLDLVDLQVDVAVRIGSLPDSDLVARRVGEVPWVICASRGYLARRGEPDRPQALADHACIVFDGRPSAPTWSFSGAPAVTVRPRFSVNTADAVIDAAAADLGLARLMSYQAGDAVGDGRVALVLAGFAPEPMPVHVLYRAQRSQPLKQRAFLDFAVPRLVRALQRIDRTLGSLGGGHG